MGLFWFRRNRRLHATVVLMILFATACDPSSGQAATTAETVTTALMPKPAGVLSNAEQSWCNDHVEEVWSVSYQGNRLLSDTTQIWCSDNLDSVEEVARQLGVADLSEPWTRLLTPAGFFRSCTAAAAARGGINTQEPGDIFVQTTRLAGFLQSDESVMLGGLAVCERFDEVGVDEALEFTIPSLGEMQGSYSTPDFSVALTVLRVIGTPEAEDRDFAVDVVIGAASVALCPEYADGVASYG